MQERPLNFPQAQDETPVNLSDNEKKILIKCADNLKNISLYFKGLLENNRLTVGLQENFCMLTEYEVTCVHNLLNYESLLVKHTEERFAEIRKLNEENTELRRQLGDRVSNDDIRERLKNISSDIKNWWSKVGCGFVRRVSLEQYVMYVEVSFSITGIGKEKQETFELLKAQGVVINEETAVIEDCDVNRDWFHSLINKTFPSGMVWEIKSNGSKETFGLRDGTFVLRNLDDLENIKTQKA